MFSISISSSLNIKKVEIKLLENKRQRHAHNKHTKDQALVLKMKTFSIWWHLPLLTMMYLTRLNFSSQIPISYL